MTPTFAETHNMIAYLTKSNASEGFSQIIDFLNGSSIKLQALVDKKKVVIMKASIRDALRFDDAEGVKCLPNEEIFTELARMGYEKPSTSLLFTRHFSQASIKFNFSKYIFDSLVRNVDSSTKFYMYPHFLQLMIKKQVGDLLTHTTKYTPPALTQKVDEGDAKVNVNDVPAVGAAAEGVISAANDEVPTAVEEPSIPSPTSPTPPSQSSQDDAGLPIDLLQNLMDTYTTLTRRVENLKQDKIAQALEITKLKSRVKKLERRNKASKLKRIIANIDADEDVVLEDANKDVVVEKSTDVQESAEPVELQEVVDVVTTAKIITEVVTAASDTITAASTTKTAADVLIPTAPTLTTTPSRRRKGVVIRDPQETTTTSTIIHSEAKSKDKGKGILEPKPLKKQAQIEQDEAYARELEAELNKNIDWDEVIDHVQRKQKEDKAVKRYQTLKRKPHTEAQARKNMMLYLKNVDGFKIDYFNGMSYDGIRLIFEKHFDSNVAFLQKSKEQMDEEDSRALKRLNESQKEKAAKNQKLDEEVEELKRHLQIVPNDEDDVYTEATPLAHKVPLVDYEIYNENNKPYYKIKRADGSHQLYLSFLSLLRNFDREDLEALCQIYMLKSEKSEKCSWSSKSQELEAVGILWCVDNYIYNNTVDFAGREEIVSLEKSNKNIIGLRKLTSCQSIFVL
nr:hypothetical protein [Tanacetum cinerariifolium]